MTMVASHPAGGLGAAGEQGDGEVEQPVVVAALVLGVAAQEVVVAGEGGQDGADLGCGAGELDAGLAVRACPGPDAACRVGVVLAAVRSGEVDLQDELAEVLGQLVGSLAVVAAEHDRDGGLSVLQGQAQLGVADGAHDGS